MFSRLRSLLSLLGYFAVCVCQLHFSNSSLSCTFSQQHLPFQLSYAGPAGHRMCLLSKMPMGYAQKGFFLKKTQLCNCFRRRWGSCNKTPVLQLCHKKFIAWPCHFAICGNLIAANACKIMRCQFVIVVGKGKATGLGPGCWEYLTLSLLFLVVCNGKMLLIYSHCLKRKKERKWSLL